MAFLTRGAPQQRVTLADALAVTQRFGRKTGNVYVNQDTAMTHSAVWAACRIRADLISTTPLDVFRNMGQRRISMPAPVFFRAPYGDLDLDLDGFTWPEWTSATQYELDRTGVSIGIVTSRDGYGKPSEIEPVGGRDLGVMVRGPQILEVRVRGSNIPLRDVWIETQYRVSGSPLGMSPIMAASRSLGSYMSAQQAAADHWAAGLQPGGMLKNTERRVVSSDQIDSAKEAFATAVQDHGLFVHGSEWEWTPVSVDGVNSSLIDELRFSVSDVARFMGVPGDLIDAAQSGTSVTYANISQRTLQFLVMHLGPVMYRRETTFNERVLPEAWYCKFNTDSLLRMDPEQRVVLTARRLQNRMITNDEARVLEDAEPLTDAQIERENLIYGAPSAYTQPTDKSVGKAGSPNGG